MSEAYDKKNKQDYENNSEAINKALMEIRKNKELKPTIAQLSKLTGIHRNTISNRIEPVQALHQIKIQREEQARKLKEKKVAKEDPLSHLEDELKITRRETIYWFNKFLSMEKDFNQKEKQYTSMKSSRDHYLELYETEKEKNRSLENRLEQITQVMKDLDKETR